jgi:hypothetical protein
VQSFIVTIEGSGWSDVQELELPRLPGEDELVETKYGTCIVVHTEALPKTDRYDGKIVCRVS